MKQLAAITFGLFLFTAACGTTPPEKNPPKTKEKTRLVLVETPYGNMKIKLYNETPQHRDNFIKLVEQKYYDSLLFHRVIHEFMIQGGDPESKNAPSDKTLGNGGPGYTIDAEFVSSLLHKKGALAAARESDQVNPDKKSSGSQFYVVHGKKFTAEALKQMEEKINFPKRKKLVFEYLDKPENAALKNRIDSLQRVRSIAELNNAYSQIALLLEPEYQKLDLFHYTQEQIEVYSTVGGTPHLDQNYTVFGEVIEGLHIIDSIAQVKTNPQDRPLNDVVMKMKVVKK